MKNNLYVLLFALTLLVTSCDDDDPIIPNEEELITTVILTLTPNDVKESVVEFTYEDLDGEGGTAATITNGTLVAGMSYTGEIQLLNELESPAEDITEEVDEEDEDHQFFYILGSDLDASFAYEDEDANGNPVGISTSWVANAASSDIVTIVLRHEPTKPNNGTIADAGGETDIEIDFNFTIE